MIQFSEEVKTKIVHCFMTPLSLLNGMSDTSNFMDMINDNSNNLNEVINISNMDIFHKVVNVSKEQFSKISIYRDNDRYVLAKYLVENFLNKYLFADWEHSTDESFWLKISGYLDTESSMIIYLYLKENGDIDFIVSINNKTICAKYVKDRDNEDVADIVMHYTVTENINNSDKDNILLNIYQVYQIDANKFGEAKLRIREHSTNMRDVLVTDFDIMENIITDAAYFLETGGYTVMTKYYRYMIFQMSYMINNLSYQNKHYVFYCALQKHTESGLARKYPDELYKFIQQRVEELKYNKAIRYDYTRQLFDYGNNLYYIEACPLCDSSNDIYEVNITIIFGSSKDQFYEEFIKPMGNFMKDEITIFTLRRLIQEYCSFKEHENLYTRAFFEDYKYEAVRWENKVNEFENVINCKHNTFRNVYDILGIENPDINKGVLL